MHAAKSYNDKVSQILFRGIYVQVDGQLRAGIVKHKFEKQGYFTETISQPDINPGRVELCLIGWQRGSVDAVAVSIVRGMGVSSGRTLRFEEMVFLPPTSFAGLLPIESQDELSEASQQASAVRVETAQLQEVLKQLGAIHPDQRPRIERLIDLVMNLESPATGNRAAILIEQRDALGVALEIFKGEAARRTVLNSSAVNETAHAESYIETLHPEYLREDIIISHDFDVAPGWRFVEKVNYHKKRFTAGRRSLQIIMANRTLIEEALGVDLIYHDELADTFVLIQYKRLTRGSKTERYQYRPDSDKSYDRELVKMRLAQEALSNLEWESNFLSYRSTPSPFFFKFCKSFALEARMSHLSEGFYVPLDLWELFLKYGERGERGGLLVSETTMKRRMSNDVFFGLFDRGMIGSQPEASDIIRSVVDHSLAGDRSVVLAFAR